MSDEMQYDEMDRCLQEMKIVCDLSERETTDVNQIDPDIAHELETGEDDGDAFQILGNIGDRYFHADGTER